jgi:phosphomevalonate kinase
VGYRRYGKLSEVNKTGLGSSSCVIVSVLTAVFEALHGVIKTTSKTPLS